MLEQLHVCVMAGSQCVGRQVLMLLSEQRRVLCEHVFRRSVDNELLDDMPSPILPCYSTYSKPSTTSRVQHKSVIWRLSTVQRSVNRFAHHRTCVLHTRVQSGVKHTNKDASRDCCIDAEGLYKRCMLFTQDQTMLSTLYTKRKHTNAHTRICTLVSIDMPHQAHPDIHTSLALISHTADGWDVPSGHGHRRSGISTIVNTHLHGLVDGRWRLTGPTRRRHVGPAKDTTTRTG